MTSIKSNTFNVKQIGLDCPPSLLSFSSSFLKIVIDLACGEANKIHYPVCKT